jgi:membrane protease YdiL (CAAX protease family)
MHVLGVLDQVRPYSVLELALFIAIYPAIEEWFFRGTLQPLLKAQSFLSWYFAGLSGSNIVTSVLFCGLHFISHPPLWALAVFIPSLIFGWAMERYKTLAAPLGLHVFYNMGYFLLGQT